ncbi:hypothetical protein TCAL_11423 [Tigriopus californicus]|uniref:G-protein coupled receptors family 1 profile domain-containing protein n=1 Tax=Tigriopus californicus TaxID=6832 RepID=A0A553NXJ7_TIGCA|nr:adenosine receptor A1-like [Tigriopus californicus]TRY70150.1 hypothetical protein TCAL_11423 [Tigriopus californicus]|eukprot:TCALIF_11423-PA protein Name:"Similar to NPFFR2 Neuropeptide FF receptor 2 (Homo sapiens)" AED:0.18 eAED:0.18 QI:0/0/0/0.66/1/1/3/0/363
MDAYKVSNETLDELLDKPADISVNLYIYIVPIFILACLITFFMNLIVILAIPMISHVSRMTKPYLIFVLSLVISDAFASLLLGFQLLMGSYLPIVHGTYWNTCLLLISEGLKLAGVIVTVFHLLVMVMIHLAGVLNPVKFKEFLTQTVAKTSVCILWFVPFAGILVSFSALPEQGFRSQNCEEHQFLSEITFRSVFSGLIVFPTIAILLLYGYFHSILWQRQTSVSSISRQNIRASKITFLIMFTCTLGWIPAVANTLLICSEGCRFQPSDLSPNALFGLHAIGNILVIFKSFSNPIIFAFRQANIRRSVHQLGCYMFCCRRVSKVNLARTSSHTHSSKRFLRTSNRESSSRHPSSKRFSSKS